MFTNMIKFVYFISRHLNVIYIRIVGQTVVIVAQMSRVLCRSVLSLRLIRVPMARSASSYLIDDPKYSFLKELGLKEKNVGVFNGKWQANGQVRFL